VGEGGFKMIKKLVYLGVMVLGAVNSSAMASMDEQEETLCSGFEEIYFSCKIDEKILSICASGNISPETGYAQYRFGKPGHIELQYPAEPVIPKGKFTVSDIKEGKLSFTHFKFKRQEYVYVVYQGSPNGVYIKKQGKTIFNKTCSAGEYQQFNRRIFRGVETVPVEEGID
jgi:hypothetical protein